MGRNFKDGAVVACSHKWEKHPENSNSVCVQCKAIGCTDSAKDPFNDGELIIIRPGEVEWHQWANQVKSNWYNRHKEMILADVRALGERKMKKKWGIGSGAWYALRKRWGLPAAITPLPPVTPTNGHLPAFPQFSDSWRPEVQLKWLDVYIAIHNRRETHARKTHT